MAAVRHHRWHSMPKAGGHLGHKIWAASCLLSALLPSPVLAAPGRGRWLQEADDRDGQEVIDGFKLKEAVNGSLDITIVPSFDIFLGFNDRRKSIEGKLTVLMMYFPEALLQVQNPQTIISVNNFADGDRYLQGTVGLRDPFSGRDAWATSNIYVGHFSQARSSFDHLCYPFDEKTVVFDISIQRPGDFIFSMELFCPEQQNETSTINGKTVVTKCTSPPQGSYVGFDWDGLVCEKMSGQTVSCSIRGVRQWWTVFMGYMLPSLIYSAMGFVSFALSVKLTMPRIATTMLALISLTNLRNTVMNMLPAAGNTSWLEEYLLISLLFMLLNLVGHAFSFFLDSHGKHSLQMAVNKVNSLGMVCVCFFVTSFRLHTRQCDRIDRGMSTAIVTLAALMVIACFGMIAYKYRACFAEAKHWVCGTHAKEEESDKAVTV